MLAVLIVLVAVLVLAVGIAMMGAGPSRVHRRVTYVPVRRRRRVVEDVVAPGAPTETTRIVEYE
jgi:hypothetical protein